MQYKTCTLLAIFLIFVSSLYAQRRANQFAEKMLAGVHFGYVHDNIDSFETEFHSSFRVGLSLYKRFYVGFRTQIIWARNFETPTRTFYSTGPWVRGYLWKATKEQRRLNMNLFTETGLLMSNYAFDYQNFTKYYVPKNGKFYVPLVLGLEVRVLPKLILEGGIQLHYNLGNSWNKRGFGYFSLGANWHPWD